MFKYRSFSLFCMLVLLAACSFQKPTATGITNRDTQFIPTITLALPSSTKTPLASPTPTPLPRHLSICLGAEPNSLFLYDATSASAKSVLAAIYDGPFKLQNFVYSPTILVSVPSLSKGDSRLEPVMVQPGDALVDANGNLGILAEGVSYRPSGCGTLECTQVYSGTTPVKMDQWVIRFQLRPSLKWSDGQALTADDSVYSYEVAAALYPSALPALVRRTQSYKALDAQSVEWRGLPGYQDGDTVGKFFSPLPRHAWGSLAPQDLRSSEISSVLPIGWGAYVLDEWTPGDHITLHRNPNYFRLSEGYPRFDTLVFRFEPDSQQALDALLAGECDVLDQNALANQDLTALQELQKQGKVALFVQPDTAWEVITFGISSQDPARPSYFGSKEVRQAAAMCIDRSAIAAKYAYDPAAVADGFIPAANPLFDAKAPKISYDPKAAADLLQKAGWIDADNNPSTPRTALSVAGVPDGTPFEVEYLTSDEPDRKAMADMIQASLAQCGIGLKVVSQPASKYLAAGPDGPVFGRKFSLAQFAWPASLQTPCALYLSSEIPGPAAPKGWGGANAGGYSNAAFDKACEDGMFSLSDAPQNRESQIAAQEIFMEDLPAIPLFWYGRLLLTRPDMCGIALDASTQSAFWNLETLDYGNACH